jgi:hypothetical protein
MKTLTSSMFVLLAFSTSAIQAGNTVEASHYPWLAPFVIDNPELKSFHQDSVSGKVNASVLLVYRKPREFAQTLFPRIDSAVKAEQWTMTTVMKTDTDVSNIYYWKNCSGQYGLYGPFNISFNFGAGGITVDLRPAPTDSAILYNIQQAHDTLQDQTPAGILQRRQQISTIAKHLAFVPQTHPLYDRLVSELGDLILHDRNPSVRAFYLEQLCLWKSDTKRHIALSLLKQSCTDTCATIRFHAALFVIEMGDTTDQLACAIINNFASGKALDSLSKQDMIPGREIEMKELLIKMARKAAKRCK